MDTFLFPPSFLPFNPHLINEKTDLPKAVQLVNSGKEGLQTRPVGLPTPPCYSYSCFPCSLVLPLLFPGMGRIPWLPWHSSVILPSCSLPYKPLPLGSPPASTSMNTQLEERWQGHPLTFPWAQPPQGSISLPWSQPSTRRLGHLPQVHPIISQQVTFCSP